MMGLFRRRDVLLLALALSLLPGPGLRSETPAFEGFLRLGGMANPVAAAAGDFDGDGRRDLAALGTGEVAVFLRDPSGRFAFRGPLPGSTAGGFHLRAADFDGDGDDDLAVADPSGTAQVLLSKGDGRFGPVAALKEAAFSRWIAFGDFDRDGALDLISANWSALTLSHYRGGRDGAFDWIKNYSPGEPHAVEAGDYDGDGRLDLLVALGSTSGLRALRWVTEGAEGSFKMEPIVGTFGCVRYLAAGDLDGDGRSDLAVSCEVTGDVFAGVSAGDGSFRRTLTGAKGDFVAIADLNGDGRRDLAVT